MNQPVSSPELLSALSDGECTPAELTRLLDEMERDATLKSAYSRRVAAREARAGVRIHRHEAAFCEGVMTRIAGETMAEPGPKVVDLDARRRWSTSAPAVRYFGGLAAAASVAALAVLVALPSLRPSAEAPGAEAAAIGAPITGSGFEIAAARRNPPALQAVAYTPEQAEQIDEMNGFLLQHSRSLADHGMGGTLRHARFAAQSQQQPQFYTAEERR